MIEQIVLGIVQGITEWLPVSSSAVLILVERYIFGSREFADILDFALFLHLGTFLAALMYFRKDIFSIARSFLFKKNGESKKIVLFLFVATMISGLLGVFLLKAFSDIGEKNTWMAMMLLGAALLVTAFFQLRAKKHDRLKEDNDLIFFDGILLGIVQGFTVLPGLSRSGLTVSALLFRKFKSETALRLSFLMSLPIVLLGNILLNLDRFVLSFESLTGVIFSFIFGLATIDLLLKLAKKVNFGYFVLVFGLLVILSACCG